MPAKIGVGYLMFAPFATEPTDALPTYEIDKLVELGRTVAANLTVNMSSGQDFANNRLTEDVNKFASGTLATEIDHMDLQTESIVYGSTYDETTGTLSDSDSDDPPYGGAAYHQLLMINGVEKFRGVFFPKVKAVVGQDNAQTRASSLTFQHSNPSFTIFKPTFGKWRYREDFDTEAEVLAWQREMLGVTEPAPGP